MAKDYIVQQGESVATIALAHGFLPDTLWDLTENAELKKLRQDMNVLLPGDVLKIPELRVREENRGTDSKHRFLRKGVPARFRVRILDEGQPVANIAYQMWVDNAQKTGQTDADGWVEQLIPPNASRIELRMEGEKEPYLFLLSHLDPLETPSGIKARLKNLGYHISTVDSNLDEESQAAVQLFQQRNDLEPNGEISQAFLDKLKQVHGS
jgi:N-acetylmuramoyl-L-alanine amidase